MSVSAPDDAFLDVNDAHLRVYGNVHADGLKLGQLEVVTTTSTGSTIQFLHQHTAFTTTSNIDVGTTNHELFVDTNLSRVGILTNTPTTALDVNGTVTATAFAGDGANLTGIPSSAINGTLSQWTTVTGPKIHYSDGNVGVGVADPAFKLDVDGDINFTGTLREDGNPFVSTPWTIESGPTALSYTGGNVGIGAGTPSAKLEVTGNAHVSTDLSVGGNLTINTISAAATHGLGAVTALSNTTAETILLTNTGTSLVASGIVTAATFSDGTAQLTGGTWSGSAARLTTAVDIGGVAFDGSASIVPTTFGAATFSGDVTVDTDTLYVDSTNNRVLIGTTTPYYSQRFEVSGGNSRFAGGVYSRSQFKRFNYNFSTSGNNNHTLTIPITGSNARGIMKLKINVVQVAPNASSADIAELEGYISAYGGTHGITATKAVRANSLYAEHICSSSTSSSGDLKIYYQPIEGYQQSVYVAFDIELQLGATFAHAGSLSHALSSSNTGVTQPSFNASRYELDGYVAIPMNLSFDGSSWYTVTSHNTHLQTGTWIVNVYIHSASGAGSGQLYDETYSGLFTWYSGVTNSNVVNDIPLHYAGHAPNAEVISMRTARQSVSAGTNLLFQVKSNMNWGGTVRATTFKFRRLI